jgi:hypothetical protein
MMKIVLFFGNGNGYEAPAYRQAGVLRESQTFNVDDARIESRGWMLDARISSFEKRVSIRASTAINFIH